MHIFASLIDFLAVIRIISFCTFELYISQTLRSWAQHLNNSSLLFLHLAVLSKLPPYFRELLQNEARLSRMYCRTALLQLIDHCNSPAMDVQLCSSSLGAGMAASAALLQELDIENIQLLSNQLLAPPHTHGTILTTSASVGMSPRHCMAPSSCSLTDVVYYNGEKLKRELAVAIARAANQGEDYLLELTNQICLCLQVSN